MPKARLALPVIVFLAALAFGAGNATAKAPCWKTLLNDWFDGRIDNTYPVHCYREALKDIPEDQIVYGTLRDDLTRALALVIRDHHGHVTGATPVPGDDQNGGDGPSSGATNASGKHDKGFFHWLAGAVGPSSADSVPVPLLVLGGLALALIAAAAISFGTRRYQARKAPGDPPPFGPDA